jgi:hypothetical protein
MRRQHHRLYMWFIPNLASPWAATWEVNIIVFVCHLHQTSLQRELLHEKSKSSSLYMVYSNPRFTGSYYMRRQNHRLCMWFILTLALPGAITWEVNIIVFCMWFRPSLSSLGAATWEENIIVFVCGIDQTRLTGSCYMSNQHNRLCMSYCPNLASLGTVTWENNIIIFPCGLDQTSLHRELLHEKTLSSSLHMV